MGRTTYDRILITGGAGFVGFNLAIFLREHGYNVSVMDNLVRRGSEMNIPRLREKKIDFFHGDIRCREDFNQLPDELDLIIECSAQPSVVSGYDNPRFDISNNFLGTVECLEFCQKKKAGMIFMSSNRIYSANKLNSLPIKETDTRFDYDEDIKIDINGFDARYGISRDFSVDGGHKSIYGVSKAAADLLCQEWATAFDLPIIVNRCGVISGEGQFGMVHQGWVVWWALAGYLGISLKYLGYHGKQVRDILFIDDLCRLLHMEIQALDKLSGRVFNVGGGKANALSLLEATDIVEKLLCMRMQITDSNEARRDDVKIYYTDNRLVTDMLGWEPRVSVEDGYEKIVRWIRDYGEQLKGLYL